MKKSLRVILVLMCLVLLGTFIAGCAKTYKVSYYDNGTLITTQNVKGGKMATAPTKPTKEGYTFENWYQDQGMTKKFDFKTMKITKDTTIYAKFVENPNPES